MIAWLELTACARMTAVSLLKFLGSTLGKVFNNSHIENLRTPCSMRDNQSAKDSKGAVDCEVAICSYSIPDTGETFVKNHLSCQALPRGSEEGLE